MSEDIKPVVTIPVTDKETAVVKKRGGMIEVTIAPKPEKPGDVVKFPKKQ